MAKIDENAGKYLKIQQTNKKNVASPESEIKAQRAFIRQEVLYLGFSALQE